MNIKLLVCYHKPAQLLRDSILTPIHVGRALAKQKMDHNSPDYKWLMSNLIGDDTGENISNKNGTYNEMTSLYWAWKNYDKLDNPDYIGLMHYRRHFVLHEGEIDVIHFDKLDEEHYFDEINYSEEKLRKLVDRCDFVAHIGKVNNVYNHYVENHRKEDIDLAFQILCEKYPKYKECAKGYFSNDYSNFCNMFIFKKDIFFDYCEWIFSILEEFERRVDTSEKRFFISERLTGIYIYRLMRKKELKYKVIPISFIADPLTIPIVMPLNEDNLFALATSITSLLINKNSDSQYVIYLLGRSEYIDIVRNKFSYYEKQYNNCTIQFVSTDVPQEYYPLVISELLQKINKCIYMNEKTIILKDLSEFFRTCSVDDYYIIGAPLENYDVFTQSKKVNSSFMVMNCSSMRRHKIYKEAIEQIKSRSDAVILFHTLLKGQLGYVPWYFMTVTGLTVSSEFFDRKKTRESYLADASWKPILFYSDSLPWNNPQGIFSNFWWNIASKVPAHFEFIAYNGDVLKLIFCNQQKEINRIASEKFIEQNNFSEKETQKTDDWRKYSFYKKLRFYYTHNGLKKTINYGLFKLTKIKKLKINNV